MSRVVVSMAVDPYMRRMTKQSRHPPGLPSSAETVLTPAEPRPRVGWAEASKKIAHARHDALVWPEFGNADDEALEWRTNRAAG
jgi:hypothetical protein